MNHTGSFSATLTDANTSALFNAAFGEPERDVTIVPASHQIGRLAIYKERIAFRARYSYDSHTNGIGETETSMSFTAVGPVTKVRAEWWRVALWYACAPVRLLKRLAH